MQSKGDAGFRLSFFMHSLNLSVPLCIEVLKESNDDFKWSWADVLRNLWRF